MMNYVNQFKLIARDSSDQELLRLINEFNLYPEMMHPEDQKILQLLKDELEYRSLHKRPAKLIKFKTFNLVNRCN